MLGLQIHGLENRIDFSPSLPSEWDHVSVENIRLPHGTMNVVLTQSKTAIALDMENHGTPTQLLFEPLLPLGARLVSSTFQGRRIASHIASVAEEEQASVSLQIPAGKSHCDLQFEGGIATVHSADQSSQLQVGAPSTHIKITAFSLSTRILSIEADVHPLGDSTLVLRTPWKIVTSTGATSYTLSDESFLHIA